MINSKGLWSLRTDVSRLVPCEVGFVYLCVGANGLSPLLIG